MKKSLLFCWMMALLPLLSFAQKKPFEVPVSPQATRMSPKPEQRDSQTIFEKSNSITARYTPPADLPVEGDNPATLLGHNPSPGQPGIIQIKYALKIRGLVRLQIMDKAGHPLRTLINEFKEKGSYIFDFNPVSFFLPTGEYICRLDTGGRIYARPIAWE